MAPKKQTAVAESPIVVTPKIDKKNLLASLKSGATAKPAATKQDQRWEILIEKDQIKLFSEVSALRTVVDQLEPTMKQREAEVKDQLIRTFCAKWWEMKKLPDNPRIIIRKVDAAGNVSASTDMSFMFQLKYNGKGLTKVLPNVESMPEGQTVDDLLIAMLQTDAVGMTEEQALKMVNEDSGEISVVQQLSLAKSLDDMMADESTKAATEKLLMWMMTGDSEALTDEERSSMLVTQQLVMLKPGFFERAHMYVSSAEQLMKLVLFVKSQLVISSVKFAESDSPVERNKRMQTYASQFLVNDKK